MELKMYLTSFALLVALAAKADALQCYNCTHSSISGIFDTGCEGPEVDDKHLITCSSGLTSCLKSQATVTVGTITVTAITRGCASALSTDSCSNVFGVTVCACSTDGCNGSSNIKTNFLSILLLAIVGKILVKNNY